VAPPPRRIGFGIATSLLADDSATALPTTWTGPPTKPSIEPPCAFAVMRIDAELPV
jgi:hypothetical protein